MDEKEVAICDIYDHRDQARWYDLDRGDDTYDSADIFDGETYGESDIYLCDDTIHCVLPDRDLYDTTEYQALMPYFSYEVGIGALALAMTKGDDRYIHMSQYKWKIVKRKRGNGSQ